MLFGARGIVIAIPVMIFLIVVFGEVLPMTMAVGMPHRFGLLVARPVLAFRWLFTPVRLLLGAFIRVVSRAAGGDDTAKAAITEAELRTLVEVGHQEGVVQRTEREMIHGVFELGETTVSEVMVPRTDVFGVDVAIPADRLLPAVRANLHHRVPVYEGSLDHVVGILEVKDLLPVLRGPAVRLRPARAPRRAALRAPVEAHRRPPARVQGEEAADGHRRRRVRRDGRHGHPRGHPRGGRRRDPRRVRGRGAARPAGGRAHLAGGRQDADRRLQRGHRASRSPTSTSIRSAAGSWISSAACPTGARASRPAGCA